MDQPSSRMWCHVRSRRQSVAVNWINVQRSKVSGALLFRLGREIDDGPGERDVSVHDLHRLFPFGVESGT
jgi:hypothetical protein